MHYFHLRVDFRDASDFEKNLDFIRRLPGKDKLLVLESKSTNATPHFHCIFNDSHSESRVRQLWKDKFPDYDGKLKKEYQFKQLKETELYDAEKYLCKGEDTFSPPNIIIQCGKYNIESVINLHTEYWRTGGPRQKLQQPIPDGTMQPFVTVTHVIEKIIKPKKNFYNDVIEYLRLQFPDREWNIRDTPIMLRAILKLHGKLFRPYGPSQIENEMNVIMNILVHESHYSDFYEVLKNRGNIPHL